MMNQQWKTEIVPGVVVTSDHDDHVSLWQVIAVDDLFAWIRLHTNRDKHRLNTMNVNTVKSRAYMFLSKGE
jgi:hypothetical protein